MKRKARYEILDSMENVIAEADLFSDAIYAYWKHKAHLIFDTVNMRTKWVPTESIAALDRSEAIY